ncbi:MAG: hypothetical protein ACFFDO_07525 [Candidatus Thorarchaeota archaeon]
MSKAVSYYDWELSFKYKNESKKNLKNGNFNAIGISDRNFKYFMNKWKKENLS